MTDKIVLLLLDLEKNIQYCNQSNPSVSKSDIGWHIEHSLLTLDKIIDRLAQSDKRDYKWKPSLLKAVIFATKTIPRGKGKSPEIVQPKGNVTSDSLARHINETKEKLNTLSEFDKDQFFEHPYFGHLKLIQAIKFLEIHTKHHLKIIRDIRSL